MVCPVLMVLLRRRARLIRVCWLLPHQWWYGVLDDYVYLVMPSAMEWRYHSAIVDHKPHLESA